jgi:hypothetical protein
MKELEYLLCMDEILSSSNVSIIDNKDTSTRKEMITSAKKEKWVR